MKNSPNVENPGNESDLPRRSRRAFCPRCGKTVDLKSYAEVADFYGYPAKKIIAMIEEGNLHRLFNRKAILMICAESFFDVTSNSSDTRV